MQVKSFVTLSIIWNGLYNVILLVNSYSPLSLVGWLCWGLTSQSTIFQSYRDGAIASWVINQYFRGVKCLAQGHNTAAVGLEPRTSRSGVRHSTTEPPRSPTLHWVIKWLWLSGAQSWKPHYVFYFRNALSSIGKIFIIDFFQNFTFFPWRVLWVCHEWSWFAEHINSHREMV